MGYYNDYGSGPGGGGPDSTLSQEQLDIIDDRIKSGKVDRNLAADFHYVEDTKSKSTGKSTDKRFKPASHLRLRELVNRRKPLWKYHYLGSSHHRGITNQLFINGNELRIRKTEYINECDGEPYERYEYSVKGDIRYLMDTYEITDKVLDGIEENLK